ncbi:MAG TPA: Gldg family protein [Salinivirgaceae bacterium]|nr:Gldg family protein [Salinivirgaceae bacterium]
MERKKLKRWQLGQLVASVLIFILIAFISSRLYFRIDLTEDKRFTINPSTEETIKKLEDVVFFKVYLEGDLPSDFIELKRAVLDLLNGFRAISPMKIEFDFVNPSEDPDPRNRRLVYEDLMRKGMRPYTIRTETKDGVVQKYVFPSLTVSYRERQIHINLFSNNYDNPNIPIEQSINEAKERLEYTVLNAIKNVTVLTPKSVAFVEDWGGLERIETYDAAVSLSEMYEVGYLKLEEQVFSLVDTIQGPIFDAIIIAKPYQKVSDKNKYIIDQYIMHGGKVLWLLDYIDVNMDSLSNSRTTTAMPLDVS